MRKFFLLLTVFLPQLKKQVFYQRGFGWKIRRRVRPELSCIDARLLTVGDDINIADFSQFSGIVENGARSTIGGRDTHIWSHTLRIMEDKQVLEATNMRIREEVYVGVGSVLSKSFPAEPCRLLLAGNPATIVKRYADQGADAPHLSSVTQEAGRS